MGDTRVLGTRTERCAGSSPVIRTKRERMDLPIKLLLAAFGKVDMQLVICIRYTKKTKVNRLEVGHSFIT